MLSFLRCQSDNHVLSSLSRVRRADRTFKFEFIAVNENWSGSINVKDQVDPAVLQGSKEAEIDATTLAHKIQKAARLDNDLVTQTGRTAVDDTKTGSSMMRS